MAIQRRTARGLLGRRLRLATSAWRSGTRRSQLLTLGALLAGVLACLVVSLIDYRLFPLVGYFLWLLLGTLLLRFVPLLALAGVTVVAAVIARVSEGETTNGGVSSLLILLASVFLMLYASSRQRSGLPGPLSEALLADLRDRLSALGRVPALPAGWHAETAMTAAYGVGYAGDFMIAELDEEQQRLELVLVDVVGKGVNAGPQALLFAGALGGLIGALPGPGLFDAANEFLLRQDAEEAFATAVHVAVDLTEGSYTILSAGHPPALRWVAADDVCVVDPSRGLALGVMSRPELTASTGVLAPGDALIFYTDGVVESRTADIEEGIDWLRATARTELRRGYDGSARRMIDQVERGDDDRALLVLARTGVRAE